jgi:hypothetical protein
MSKNKHQRRKISPPQNKTNVNIETKTETETETTENRTETVIDETTVSVIQHPNPMRVSPQCGLIVVDHFYNNPMETREFILTQPFTVMGNYPGQRTISYATEELKQIFQSYVYPFGGKITEFHIPKPDMSDASKIYNGAFQYTTARDRSWVHLDGFNNWAGVLYLTPDAPLTAGTGFYRYREGPLYTKTEMLNAGKKTDTDKASQDITKWEKVDTIGNVFNRLILFNAYRFHMSLDYFGDSKENGRLFQVFFFSTER